MNDKLQRMKGCLNFYRNKIQTLELERDSVLLENERVTSENQRELKKLKGESLAKDLLWNMLRAHSRFLQIHSAIQREEVQKCNSRCWWKQKNMLADEEQRKIHNKRRLEAATKFLSSHMAAKTQTFQYIDVSNITEGAYHGWLPIFSFTNKTCYKR